MVKVDGSGGNSQASFRFRGPSTKHIVGVVKRFTCSQGAESGCGEGAEFIAFMGPSGFGQDNAAEFALAAWTFLPRAASTVGRRRNHEYVGLVGLRKWAGRATLASSSRC